MRAILSGLALGTVSGVIFGLVYGLQAGLIAGSLCVVFGGVVVGLSVDYHDGQPWRVRFAQLRKSSARAELLRIFLVLNLVTVVVALFLAMVGVFEGKRHPLPGWLMGHSPGF